LAREKKGRVSYKVEKRGVKLYAGALELKNLSVMGQKLAADELTQQMGTGEET